MSELSKSPTQNKDSLDLHCPICQSDLHDAVIISCGHSFCRDCIEEWLQIKPICPLCSKNITSPPVTIWLLQQSYDTFSAEAIAKRKQQRQESINSYKKSFKIVTHHIEQELVNASDHLNTNELYRIAQRLSIRPEFVQVISARFILGLVWHVFTLALKWCITYFVDLLDFIYHIGISMRRQIVFTLMLLFMLHFLDVDIKGISNWLLINTSVLSSVLPVYSSTVSDTSAIYFKLNIVKEKHS